MCFIGYYHKNTKTLNLKFNIAYRPVTFNNLNLITLIKLALISYEAPYPTIQSKTMMRFTLLLEYKASIVIPSTSSQALYLS